MSWIFWSLLSAFFAGLTAVLAKLGVSGVGSNLATAIRTSVVLVLAWAIAIISGEADGLAAVSRRTCLFLILSGVATGLSWVCYFKALQLGDASRVAPLDKLSVVFVLAFAALFLGEPLQVRTILGALLIVSGAVILSLKHRRRIDRCLAMNRFFTGPPSSRPNLRQAPLNPVGF